MRRRFQRTEQKGTKQQTDQCDGGGKNLTGERIEKRIGRKDGDEVFVSI